MCWGVRGGGCRGEWVGFERVVMMGFQSVVVVVVSLEYLMLSRKLV